LEKKKKKSARKEEKAENEGNPLLFSVHTPHTHTQLHPFLNKNVVLNSALNLLINSHPLLKKN
jgi:hypothetical protein